MRLMAREPIDAGNTDESTEGQPTVFVTFTDGHQDEYYEDYEILSDGWVRLVRYHEPGHAEHGQSELVPARRIEALRGSAVNPE